MITLSIKKWLKERPLFEDVIVEGIEFPLASLSKEKIDLIKVSSSRSEMLEIAADNGIAFNRNRLSENENQKDDNEVIWSMEEMKAQVSPSIKHQVGEKVMELSGIIDVLAIKGEDDHEGISAEQLEADTKAANEYAAAT